MGIRVGLDLGLVFRSRSKGQGLGFMQDLDDLVIGAGWAFLRIWKSWFWAGGAGLEDELACSISTRFSLPNAETDLFFLHLGLKNYFNKS